MFSVRLEREREILGFFFFSFFSFDVVELDAADDCCYKAVESSVLRFLLGFCRCLCWKVFVEIPERARDSARGRKKKNRSWKVFVETPERERESLVCVCVIQRREWEILDSLEESGSLSLCFRLCGVFGRR